jgi:outer membrane murein-binding lipoprotein Lpp
MANNGKDDDLQALAARVTALETVLDNVLSTLVLRGYLNRAEADQILRDSEGTLRSRNTHPAGLEQLHAVRDDLASHIRAAQGSGGDDHDH